MTDPILLWNAVSLEANRVSHTNGQGEQLGPTLSSRALAIVHLAMYDAYAGVVNDSTNYPRYDDKSPMPPKPFDPKTIDDVIAAAVAGAAYSTLSDLFKSQRPYFDAFLDATGGKGTPGYDYGVKVGESILELRKGDPGAGGDYTPSNDRGKHRLDPDNPTQGFYSPKYGEKSKGFAITKRHELAPPPFTEPKDPAKDTAEYIAAVREVRGLGIRPDQLGTLPSDLPRRTASETLAGIFWGYDGVPNLGTPPREYNQIIRQVAMTRKNKSGKINSPGDNARLFAFVNAAMGDAGILAWDQKYIHNFWRPILGVREHDRSMGPNDATEIAANQLVANSDPQWLPLGAQSTNRTMVKNFTPNFPAYPSGHATFGAAAFHITRLFYEDGGSFPGNLKGDKLFEGQYFVSGEYNGQNADNNGTIRPRHRRTFAKGLFDMIIENGKSRLWLGVHWVFDAFAVKGDDRQPDLTRQVQVDVDGKKVKRYIGGVPLGLLIAEDIFGENKRAPKKSTVGPRTEMAVAEGTPAAAVSRFEPASPKT
jgi:vanadium chloroperoxidase